MTLLIVDDSLIRQLAPVAAELESVKHFVVVGSGNASALPGSVLRRDEDQQSTWSATCAARSYFLSYSFVDQVPRTSLGKQRTKKRAGWTWAHPQPGTPLASW